MMVGDSSRNFFASFSDTAAVLEDRKALDAIRRSVEFTIRHSLQVALFYIVNLAILFAALTTIFGFGSLVLSHFPGLRSMGLVAVFGTVCCALAALTFLPALLYLRDQR